MLRGYIMMRVPKWVPVWIVWERGKILVPGKIISQGVWYGKIEVETTSMLGMTDYSDQDVTSFVSPLKEGQVVRLSPKHVRIRWRPWVNKPKWNMPLWRRFEDEEPV